MLSLCAGEREWKRKWKWSGGLSSCYLLSSHFSYRLFLSFFLSKSRWRGKRWDERRHERPPDHDAHSLLTLKEERNTCWLNRIIIRRASVSFSLMSCGHPSFSWRSKRKENWTWSSVRVRTYKLDRLRSFSFFCWSHSRERRLWKRTVSWESESADAGPKGHSLSQN